MSAARVPGSVPIGLVVRETTRADDRHWEIHRFNAYGTVYLVASFCGNANRAWLAFEQAMKAYPNDRIRLLTENNKEQK